MDPASLESILLNSSLNLDSRSRHGFLTPLRKQLTRKRSLILSHSFSAKGPISILETRNLLSTKPSAPAFITTSLTEIPKLFNALPMSNINPCLSQVISVITFKPVSSSRAMVTKVSPIEAGTSSFDDDDVVDVASFVAVSVLLLSLMVVLVEVLVSPSIYSDSVFVFVVVVAGEEEEEEEEEEFSSFDFCEMLAKTRRFRTEEDSPLLPFVVVVVVVVVLIVRRISLLCSRIFSLIFSVSLSTIVRPRSAKACIHL